MAALGHTVDPGSGASGDYASLDALIVAQAQDLTDGGGDTYTATCTTTGDKAADTTLCTINGWTTGAANYILIEAASTDRASASGWDTNKYRIENTDNESIWIYENFVRIDGLQIGILYSSTANEYVLQIGATITAVNDIRISNVYLRTAANQRGFRINDADAIVKIWNTIFAIGGGYYGLTINSTTVDIYNCVIYGASAGGGAGINRTAGTVTVINSAVFNNADDFNGTITEDYCASDDGDGNNPVTPANWADVFENAAVGDFRLKSTDTDLHDSGTDNPGSGLYSDDIEGTTRVSTWDIGAFEFVAAPAVGNRVPIIDHHNRMMAMMGD